MKKNKKYGVPISIKTKLLPPADRLHYISQSIFDYSWIDKVKSLGSHFIFISAGVLIYFDNDTAKSLLNTLSHKFPGSSVMFPSITNRDAFGSNGNCISLSQPIKRMIVNNNIIL